MRYILALFAMATFAIAQQQTVTKCSPQISESGQIEFVCATPTQPPAPAPVVIGDQQPVLCWTQTGPARIMAIQPEKGIELSLLKKPDAPNEWKIPMGYGIPVTFLGVSDWRALPAEQRWAMLSSPAAKTWSIVMVSGACADALLARLKADPL